MSFKQLMQNRYTTKMYDNSKKIDAAKIEELKEILRLCPSSINSQPWNFIFVTNTELKHELANASLFNDEKIRNCDTLVVFSCINNIQLFESQIQKTHPTAALDYYAKYIKSQADELKRVWFSRQVYISLGFFLSACAQMGIDSTPLEGIERDKYDSILKNDDYSTLFAVAIGYRHNEDFNQLDRKPKFRKAAEEVIKVP